MGRFVTGLLGVRARGGPCDGALGRRAEDARHGQPGSRRSRRAGRADAPSRLRLRRSHGGSGDGAANRAHRHRRRCIGRRVASSTSARGGYAVFPVYKTDIDNVVGILHAIDVIKAMAAGRKNVTAADIAREALTVPETHAGRRSAGGIAASRRARSARHRRIRRHGRSRHVRVVDGADRRQRRHGRRRQDFGCVRMVRQRSTG